MTTPETPNRKSAMLLTIEIAKRPRDRLWQIHRWLGLVMGILFAVMGLSGSAIVFLPELDRQLHPHLMQVTPQGQPQSIDFLVAPVLKSDPDRSIDSIKFPQTDRQLCDDS